MYDICRRLPRSKFSPLLSLILLLILLLAAHPGPARGQEEAVDICPSGCRYSSIQQAINASTPGVTLRVGAGTYRESITLRARISLIGMGSGSTIVSGNGSQPRFGLRTAGRAPGRTRGIGIREKHDFIGANRIVCLCPGQCLLLADIGRAKTVIIE